jgi:N-acetylated-alpha-linked acidic dipeptidase
MIVNEADGKAAYRNASCNGVRVHVSSHGKKRMIWPMLKTLAAAALIVSAMSWPSGHVQVQVEQNTKAVQQEVSAAEIDRTLRAIDVDRTSGSDGERDSAKYLDRKLAGYGIAHMMYDSHLYLSWPGRAELVVPAIGTIRGKTAAFGAATPKDGLRGRVVFEPKLTRRVDQSLAFDSDVRGRIPVVRGIADTEALVLAGQQAGALAVLQIDATDILHEDIVTTTWGTPTPESAMRLPKIPYMCITKSDGERLKSAATKGPITASLVAEVTRGWRTVPIVVADVPGRTPDFVLVATHLDAWYHGMTDTGGSVASILDMARVLQRHTGEMQRGVRFAWWTGHSFGRYAGSSWYVDRFWADLDRHCVAYTNLDGPGRRGSQLDAVSSSGWPGLAAYAREFAARLTGKAPAATRGATRPFRPGRDSDSAFQGLGVPFFSIGVPDPARGSPDVDAAGRVVYWHTAEDTFDKLDMKALELDTQYRVAQLYDLATMRVLPHQLEPIAAAYVAALEDLAASAGSAFALSSTIELATALDDAAARFDRATKPATDVGIAEVNTLVVRLTHELNSALYARAGRFDQDPAAELPVLPLLARVKDLAMLSREGDEFGFLETDMIRGRNNVESTLRHAAEAINGYLAQRP